MDNELKIKTINKMFNILDKKDSGMTDLALKKELSIYPLSFFNGYLDGFFEDVTINEIGGEINCAIATDSVIRTFMTVAYKDVRGFAKFHPGKILRNDIVFYKNNSKIGITNVYGTHDFKKFELISRKNVDNTDFIKSEKRTEATNGILRDVSFAAQINFFSDYLDMVEIKSGKTTIKIPSNPEATKEILKLRDVPEGLKRRQMIINWVINHTRKIDRGEINIKKHKRGKTEFKWLGYDVTVYKNV